MRLVHIYRVLIQLLVPVVILLPAGSWQEGDLWQQNSHIF